MTIYKSKWYLCEPLTFDAYFVRQDITPQPTIKRLPANTGLVAAKGDMILADLDYFRLTRALTVAQCDGITQDWIDNNVDFERAAASYSAYPRNRWQELVDYTPEYEWIWDKTLGDIFAYTFIPVADFTPAEPDWEYILRHPSTQLYIQWYKEGHLPPPLYVVQYIDDGHLVSCNRRRWLAAREAGIKELPCYYSPTTPEGRPAWSRRVCYLDHKTICTWKPRGNCTTCPDRSL